MAILSLIYAVVLVALGLGFVIFIHELGHFLLAKWNDVKVEKFSIGFGPTIFGFRRGETEYVLAAIPLGGFVKMLGEGTEDEQTKSTDPRAYPNKSVGARMAIISAGVIMNIVPGAGLLRLCLRPGHGRDPRAGRRRDPGLAGLQGRHAARRRDRLDRRPQRHQVHHADAQGLAQPPRPGPAVRRPASGSRRGDRDGHPAGPRGQERAPDASVSSRAIRSTIAGFLPPAGMANPPEYPGLVDQTVPEDLIDTLAAAGPADGAAVPLGTIEEYMRLLAAHPNAAIKHLIDRRSASSGEDGPVKERLELTLPPAQFVDFGLRMTIEPIGAIQAGSPAEAAGFRPGDRIVKVNGRGLRPDATARPLLARTRASR